MSSQLFRRLKPFFLISVVFGLTGCKIGSGRLEASRSYIHRIRVVVTAIVAGAITYKFSENSIDDLISSSLFRNFMSEKQLKFFKAYLSYLSVCAALFIGTFRQRSMIVFFQKAEKYDEKVELLGYKKKSEFFIIWINLIVEFVVIAARIRDLVSTETLPVAWRVFKLIYEILEYYMVFSLCLKMYLLYDRFRHLNDTVVPKLLSANTHQRESFVLCQVKNLHTTLYGMANEFNGNYDGIIVPWILEALIDTVAIYSKFNVPSLKLIRLVCFFVLCDKVSKESSRTGYQAMKERRTPTYSSANAIWLETALYFHNHIVDLTAFDLLRLKLPSLMVTLNETILVYLLKLSGEGKVTRKAQRMFVD